MINAVTTANINPIQMFSAVNAFKSTEKVQDSNILETSDGMGINDSSILENQNIDEIKKFAQIAGEQNLSDDDIKYGVTYGRSVIADYVI